MFLIREGRNLLIIFSKNLKSSFFIGGFMVDIIFNDMWLSKILFLKLSDDATFLPIVVWNYHPTGSL